MEQHSASQEHEPRTLQEMFFRGFLQGLSEYPQMTYGSDIFGGNAIIDFMDGNIETWKQFLDTELTEQQLAFYSRSYAVTN